MKQSIVEKIKNSPKEPGVYIFYGKTANPRLRSGNNLVPLYVGKAANLRNRLKSYLKITDSKTKSLHEEATKLDYIILRSEIEALIEESRLIKELKPKYNILWRDDKSYLYVYFTKETYPKVYIGHEKPRRIRNHELRSKGAELSHNSLFVLRNSRIGPFTDGNSLRLAMKTIRRYFPYCTCLRPHLRDCLNAQIGRCFGFCCLKNATSDAPEVDHYDRKKEYGRNIKKIKMILRGQSRKLLKTLTNEKERAALEKIFEHQPYLADSQLGLANKVTRSNKDQKNLVASGYTLNPSRVECYDISNFAGKEAVGAMTVLTKHELGIMNYEWVPDKSQWRKFKIKSLPAGRQARRGVDDPRAIAEILSRRLRHPEWPYPDLIIIDGGITQYRAALKAQSEIPEAKNIKITAYPKPQKTLLGWPNAPEEIKKLAEQIIYQTHNFVIRYHRKLRNKALFDIIK